MLEEILDTHDLWILSVVNPDGYEYSHTTYRYWRKNRVPNRNGYCNGVDLNRNYGFKFGNLGASPDFCSDIHHGMTPFSQNVSLSSHGMDGSHDFLLMSDQSNSHFHKST